MLKINGEDWRIVLVSPNHPKLQRSDGSYTIGVCDDPDKTIYICDGLELNLMKKVLSHEITHAAMFSYNVEMSVEQEEIVADIIATYGQEIIRNANLIFHRLKENREPN